jgi:hypothetical protein
MEILQILRINVNQNLILGCSYLGVLKASVIYGRKTIQENKGLFIRNKFNPLLLLLKALLHGQKNRAFSAGI